MRSMRDSGVALVMSASPALAYASEMDAEEDGAGPSVVVVESLRVTVQGL